MIKRGFCFATDSRREQPVREDTVAQAFRAAGYDAQSYAVIGSKPIMTGCPTQFDRSRQFSTSVSENQLCDRSLAA